MKSWLISFAMACALLLSQSVPVITEDSGANGEVKAPFPAVSDALWQEYLEAASATEKWKLYAAFQPTDFEPLVERWQEILGRALSPSIEPIPIYMGSDPLPVPSGVLKLDYHVDQFKQWHPILIHESHEGRTSTYSVPQRNLAAEEIQFVASISIVDAFNERVENFKRIADASEIIRECCDLIGCNYVVPVKTAEVAVHFREASIREVITAVADCAGFTVGRMEIGSASMSTPRILERTDERPLVVLREGEPVELYAAWFDSVRNKITPTSRFTLRLTPAQSGGR